MEKANLWTWRKRFVIVLSVFSWAFNATSSSLTFNVPLPSLSLSYQYFSPLVQEGGELFRNNSRISQESFLWTLIILRISSIRIRYHYSTCNLPSSLSFFISFTSLNAFKVDRSVLRFSSKTSPTRFISISRT